MRILIAASVCTMALAGAAQADEQECPTAFKGANVSAAKLRHGVSLEFRNPNRAHVAEMRAQLREVAELLEQHGAQTQTTGDEDEPVEFPPVDITVKDIVLGARVTVRAARASDIQPLRELAFGFAEYWKTSPCVQDVVRVRYSR